MPLIEEHPTGIDPWATGAQRRYLLTEDGAIRDSEAAGEAVWWVPLADFELWMADIERLLGRSLGRRLSNAASQSEMLRPKLNPVASLMARLSRARLRQSHLTVAAEEWSMRGLGKFTVLESDNQGARIELENAAHGALCAGLALAMFERIDDSAGSHRHRWNDLGDGRAAVLIERDEMMTPAARRLTPDGGPLTPADLRGSSSDRPHLLEHGRQVGGAVSIDGVRFTAIDSESVVRFAESSATVAGQVSRSAEQQAEGTWSWPAEFGQASASVSSAMAEATMIAFLRSEALVLAERPEDWQRIGRQHLSARGIGAVLSAESPDLHELRLTCSSCIHPALLAGTLAGCWERVEGRRAAVRTAPMDDHWTVTLQPLHEIAATSGLTEQLD